MAGMPFCSPYPRRQGWRLFYRNEFLRGKNSKLQNGRDAVLQPVTPPLNLYTANKRNSVALRTER
jgi:hypothetical protein